VTSHRAMAVDAAAILVVSVAISLACQQLVLMTVLVPSVLALRLIGWAFLPAPDRNHSLGVEIAFFAACTALGAFNDWNSVVNHQIYDYAVPHFFPNFSTIPIWMLLYWGMILRFLASLCTWQGLGATPARNRIGPVTSSAGKLALMLLLVLVTRQFIYRFYLEELISWLPFAAALVLHVALFGLDQHERRLIVLMAVGGTAIEGLYIQVGGLHSYHLDWIVGVPLWITLWWVLGILVWKEFSSRFLLRVGRRKHFAF
jgi:hypothetical protein